MWSQLNHPHCKIKSDFFENERLACNKWNYSESDSRLLTRTWPFGCTGWQADGNRTRDKNVLESSEIYDDHLRSTDIRSIVWLKLEDDFTWEALYDEQLLCFSKVNLSQFKEKIEFSVTSCTTW